MEEKHREEAKRCLTEAVRFSIELTEEGTELHAVALSGLTSVMVDLGEGEEDAAPRAADFEQRCRAVYASHGR